MQRPLSRVAPLLAVLALVAPPLAAQGADDCAAAQPIAGQGTFPFDNTTATQDGTGDPACGSNDQIERDVWFDWTADETGVAVVATCGLASFDTKIAAYAPGPCPPSGALDCDDDTCGLQSRIQFPVRSGEHVLLRIGVWPTAAGGAGQISIDVDPDAFDCSQPAAGPDVFVGNVTAIYHWGALGGVDAYSIGATACNGGDAVLPWYGASAQHPVIAQNLYRLEGGHLEQIGLSWLKHGFGAATESACCPCQNPGNNQLLGIGCADTYSAQLNGNQQGFGTTGGMGPRSDLNASTGVFPWPYTTMGQAGDLLYKRLQVASADLDPALHPDALYFAEVQYLTPDDAQAGHGANNASYRRVVVTGPESGGFGLTMAPDPTAQRDPAILAWAAADPGVLVSTIDVPGDGRFLVASRASDNGDGTWHYAYAVHNLSSHRSARALTIPKPEGVTASGLKFVDLAYHSGEVYDGADWTGQASPGRVSWNGPDYGLAPLGNALRFGTLYAFRFDADRPPTTASAGLSLFRPGMPTSVSCAVVAPSDPQDGPGAAFCFGDGSGAPCPCGNASPTAGEGCVHSAGHGMTIEGSGTASIAADDLVLRAEGCPPGNTGIFYSGKTSLAPGAPLYDGLQCAGGDVRRYQGLFQLDGVATDTGFVAQDPSGTYFLPAATVYWQYWTRDVSGPCGTGASFSPGYAVTMAP